MRYLRASTFVFVILFAPSLHAQDDLNGQLEKVMNEAVKKVAPSVVQIVTQGGTDMVVASPKGPVFRKALGPTTGLIVDADGYIISSAFNFINNPTTILVSVPGHPNPLVAKRIATDKSKMVTLLKVDATGLPAPAPVPVKDIQVGQWTMALGRSLDAKPSQPPSVSVGIISAVGRIWSKALQTDAKISPVNYGGPIVDITGRVQGILIPASPDGQDETAGFEWYDSGIGFAIPYEDILKVLPRLKEGKDLKKGVVGVRMKSQDIYGEVPEIAQVLRESAAGKAGLRAGDIITEFEGQPVTRMAQVLHYLGPKYEGDTVNIKYKRGTQELAAKLELAPAIVFAGNPFIGILPMRDDPRLGVEIRYVFPKSPAEKAGLVAGDRIVAFREAGPGAPKFDDKMPGGPKTPPKQPKGGPKGKDGQSFAPDKSGRDGLLDWLSAHSPGDEIELTIVHKDDKRESKTLALESLPGTASELDWKLPAELPTPSSLKKALEPLESAKGKKAGPKTPSKGKAETGSLKRTTPDGEHKYWLYVSDSYDPNISYGVVLWLHPPEKNKEADFDNLVALWRETCFDNHLILVAPVSANENGWVPSESGAVLDCVRDAMSRYTVDPQRIVAHGLGVGGQMAIYLGFQNRELFHGVAAVGAIAGAVKDNVPNERLAFYLAVGERDPLLKTVTESAHKLTEKRYSIFYREMPNRGREYLDADQIAELGRWVDMLDRE